jgi:hypothetical protein
MMVAEAEDATIKAITATVVFKAIFMRRLRVGAMTRKCLYGHDSGS